jgi:hypothetical protein
MIEIEAQCTLPLRGGEQRQFAPHLCNLAARSQITNGMLWCGTGGGMGEHVQ